MDRCLRILALAICGVTLVWLAGCNGGESGSGSGDVGGSPSMAEIAAEIDRRNSADQAAEAEAAQAAAQAEADQIANEQPSEITKNDYKKGSKITSNGYLGTVVREGRRAGEDVQLQNIKHQLEIHGLAQGYPRSHEAFIKLVTQEWGMQLPELVDGYEYRYDPKTHEILKQRVATSPAE